MTAADKEAQLLEANHTEEKPAVFLRRLGVVFAEFGPSTQDSGNVSYGLEADGKRFFIKTAGPPDNPNPFLEHADRVGALRNAVRVATSLSHPCLPRLWNVIESPSGPMLVYDWIEGELLGVRRAERTNPLSPHQRFRALPPEKITRFLDQIYDLHRGLARLGWIAVDFYDGCLIYDFITDQLGVVDLDMYHQGPFTNEMGRMFGSTRFMAPEEFELGAKIDEQTNVFVMGRAGSEFLANGSLSREKFRGTDAQHEVIKKACDPNRSNRFASLEQFYGAWEASSP